MDIAYLCWSFKLRLFYIDQTFKTVFALFKLQKDYKLAVQQKPFYFHFFINMSLLSGAFKLLFIAKRKKESEFNLMNQIKLWIKE